MSAVLDLTHENGEGKKEDEELWWWQEVICIPLLGVCLSHCGVSLERSCTSIESDRHGFPRQHKVIFQFLFREIPPPHQIKISSGHLVHCYQPSKLDSFFIMVHQIVRQYKKSRINLFHHYYESFGYKS